MSDIFLCCVKHGLVGYIIGVVFILVIRIIQTNGLAYGNSYTIKQIIEDYIYDIKMSTVEGIVGLIVGLVVGVVFELVCHNSSIDQWGLLIVPVITIGLTIITYLLILFIGLSISIKRK